MYEERLNLEGTYLMRKDSLRKNEERLNLEDNRLNLFVFFLFYFLKINPKLGIVTK